MIFATLRLGSDGIMGGDIPDPSFWTTLPNALMQFVIELDGPIVDVRRRYCQAHRLVQGKLGLPSREANEFWRLLRKGASLGEIVRPTRPAQPQEYARRFEETVVSDSLLALDEPQPDVAVQLAALAAIAPCHLIALRSNPHAAQRLLDRNDLGRFFQRLRLLSQERSVRASQLAELASESDQTLAAVASESLVLAAQEAGAVVIGLEQLR